MASCKGRIVAFSVCYHELAEDSSGWMIPLQVFSIAFVCHCMCRLCIFPSVAHEINWRMCTGPEPAATTVDWNVPFVWRKKLPKAIEIHISESGIENLAKAIQMRDPGTFISYYFRIRGANWCQIFIFCLVVTLCYWNEADISEMRSRSTAPLLTAVLLSTS